MPSQGLIQLLTVVRPALQRFLAARGATPEEADDLLQDLYIKLAGQAIGPVAEPRAYLYRMANNLLVDRRRSGIRRSRREEDWAGTQSGAMFGIDDRPPADEVLIAGERLKILEDALAALPDRTFEVFLRFRVNDEPQKSIAGDLGISVSAVEKHLQRAYRVVMESRATLDADAVASRRLPHGREFHGG